MKTSKDGPQATTIRGVQSSLTSKMVGALSEPLCNPPASFHVIQTCSLGSLARTFEVVPVYYKTIVGGSSKDCLITNSRRLDLEATSL